MAKDYYLKNGDIVFARTGATVGKTYLYDHRDGQLVYAGFLIKFAPNIQKLLPYYLKLYTETKMYWHWVSITSQRSGQPGINASEYCSFKMIVPPIKEQKKIAEVLSEWDKAIELQTKLIEKQELRKRALMQRLLTGRVRLNGFSDKWDSKDLSEVGVFLSSNTLSRDKLNGTGGDIQNIHYGDILIHYPTIVNIEQCLIPYINKDVIVTSDWLQDGDIVFADAAEDNTVGKAIEIVNVKSQHIVAGLHTMPFRPNKGLFAKSFLGYYVNSTPYQKQLVALTQGIKVCSINKNSIKKTSLQIPSLSEQTAIAEVLVLADKEIEIAKNKLSLLRYQKRGVIHQLLTGKKRMSIKNMSNKKMII